MLAAELDQLVTALDHAAVQGPGAFAAADIEHGLAATASRRDRLSPELRARVSESPYLGFLRRLAALNGEAQPLARSA